MHYSFGLGAGSLGQCRREEFPAIFTIMRVLELIYTNIQGQQRWMLVTRDSLLPIKRKQKEEKRKIHMEKNVGNYLDCIEFETEVYPGVYWVPLHSLGKTRYSNEEMKQMSTLPMEEKKEKIQNLYEAVQLFQCIEFKGALDNVSCLTSWKELWEIHKNRENSVHSNKGCCATDTNWLSYFLEGKYDSLGAFCYNHEDANGHITTYIKQDENYYFIDMMMCRADSQEYFKKETGNLSEIENGLWSGYLYRCKNPYDYCLFTIEKFKETKRAIPYCFYIRETLCVEATGVRIKEDGITLLIPENENPQLLYLQEDSKCNAEIVPLPNRVRKEIERLAEIKNYEKGNRNYLKLIFSLALKGSGVGKKKR